MSFSMQPSARLVLFFMTSLLPESAPLKIRTFVFFACREQINQVGSRTQEAHRGSPGDFQNKHFLFSFFFLFTGYHFTTSTSLVAAGQRSEGSHWFFNTDQINENIKVAPRPFLNDGKTKQRGVTFYFRS